MGPKTRAVVEMMGIASLHPSYGSAPLRRYRKCVGTGATGWAFNAVSFGRDSIAAPRG
jgi:hypothetical protein